MKTRFDYLPRLVTSRRGLASTQLSLRVRLENGFQVAQATRLCRPATRRTEREQRFEALRTAFSKPGSPQFRSAGRRPGRATRPRYQFSKHVLRAAIIALVCAAAPVLTSAL